jgi:hypothetical protein
MASAEYGEKLRRYLTPCKSGYNTMVRASINLPILFPLAEHVLNPPSRSGAFVTTGDTRA